MNDDSYTIKSGHLDVGDGHKIYYQQWGNHKAEPIFFLHGGPGSGCKDKYKLTFDPKKHHVIFHDQRGSGLSTPFAAVDNNTTNNLVKDIETLRNHFKFSRISLSGGSWGSFLALVYAVSYPENVEKMLLRGIFTGTKAELDHIQQGGIAKHYPEAWQQYIELVPKNKQNDTSSYYFDKLLNGTDEEKREHTKRWVLLEASAMSIDDNYPAMVLSTESYDEQTTALAILEAHYFTNNCFKSDDFLYVNASKLKDIPIVFVHGRFDHVCPPESAYSLAKRIGENCHLHYVPAGHGNDPALRETFRAYAWSFLG